jgi:hypothetical protein
VRPAMRTASGSEQWQREQIHPGHLVGRAVEADRAPRSRSIREEVEHGACGGAVGGHGRLRISRARANLRYARSRKPLRSGDAGSSLSRFRSGRQSAMQLASAVAHIAGAFSEHIHSDYTPKHLMHNHQNNAGIVRITIEIAWPSRSPIPTACSTIESAFSRACR